jgi:hypothetical protein
MKHHYIGIRQALHRLETQAHDGAAVLDYLNVTPCAWHKIDALGTGRAGNLQVPTPDKLVNLLRGEHIPHETGSHLSAADNPLKYGWKINHIIGAIASAKTIQPSNVRIC